MDVDQVNLIFDLNENRGCREAVQRNVKTDKSREVMIFCVFYCDQKGKEKKRVCRRTGDRRQEGSKLLQTGEQDRGTGGLFMLGTG